MADALQVRWSTICGPSWRPRRWAEYCGFSLGDRIRSGRLFTEREIDDLSRTLRLRRADVPFAGGTKAPHRRRSGVESLRRLKTLSVEGLEPRFAANLMRFVRDYLVWFARSSQKPEIGPEIDPMADRFSVRARCPMETPIAPRRGLDQDQRSRPLSLVDPEESDNPFAHPPTRFRTTLIVRLLYATGVRRGELAGLKVRDIDPKVAIISVHRRGGDPEDARTDPPRAKTGARSVPCDPALVHQLERYILDVRRRETAARKHPFLFVSHWVSAVGAPLSTRQIGKIFETLSGILGLEVHAHLLRHTWNDRFSEIQDARPGPRVEATEERVRAVLMGWSPSFKMPARHSRRHTERDAEESMRTMAMRLTDDE